jgi:hypothetical protein
MAEHVSFFWGKVKPGMRQGLIDQMNKWDREQKSKAKGFIRSILVFGNKDQDDFGGVVRHDSTANYMANAGRPEQDAWYQELMKNVDGEIQWFDATLAGEWKA